MRLRTMMMAACVAVPVPLSTVPVLAQETGNVSSGYLGGLYQMEHTPAEGSVSSLSSNEPASRDATSNLAMRQAPTVRETTSQPDNPNSAAATRG
jgi:hypothetical protein